MSDKNLAVDKVLFAGALGEYQQRLEAASGFRVRRRVGLTSASMYCSHAEVLTWSDLDRFGPTWEGNPASTRFATVSSMGRLLRTNGPSWRESRLAA